MNDKILAVDIGFAATGMALFQVTKAGEILVTVQCVREDEDKSKTHTYAAEVDVERTSRSVRKILDFIKLHDVKRIVCELPSAGAQGARANRCMGIATGMIAAVVQSCELAVEWYTPTEVKNAAVGKPSASKDEMMDAMEKVYPDLAKIKKKADKEHICDAAACYVAAKNGNMVKMLKSML